MDVKLSTLLMNSTTGSLQKRILILGVLIPLCISFAGKILPVVQKQHQLLVTLLLCNAAAMEVSRNHF